MSFINTNKFLEEFFSEKHAKKEAVADNFVLLLMYKFAYPFALLLSKFKFSPNLITTQSLVFSLLAFLSLVLDEGWAWFSVFWGVTVLLDFCDGTVARMTNKVSKQAFRYDHMSDLFKIFLLFLGTGLRYDTGLVWTVSVSVLFLYMYFMILNHDVVHIRKLASLTRPLSDSSDMESDASDTISDDSGMRIRDQYRIIGWLVKFQLLYKAFRLFLAPLTTINGHTLLLFLLLPFGPEYAVCVLSYLGLIALNGIRSRISQLLMIPKP